MVVLRHVIIGVLSLALLGGTGWQACATLQQHAPVAAVDEMASSHSTRHHDHMASAEHDDAQTGAPIDIQSNGDNRACLKCCGACMLGSIVPLAPEWTVTRVMSRVSFPSENVQLRGLIVFIDPDIPKSVA